MNLRCADGDIAVITWDYPECLENIGRLVKVSGPIRMEDGLAKWYICPVTPELYAVQEIDGSFVRESVTWDSNVIHPDSWMIPIREQESDIELAEVATEAVEREKPPMALIPESHSACNEPLRFSLAGVRWKPLAEGACHAS